MLRIDRRLVSHFEWPLLALVMLVVGVGLATILSATYDPARPISPYVTRQAMWTGIGLVVLLLTLAFDYRLLDRYAYPLYAASLVLLVLVPLVGSSGGGARRWLSIGSVSIQPSEFMKVTIVLALARSLHRQVGEPRLAFRALLAPAVIFSVPAYLVLAQPDLGTMLALAFGAFTLLLLAGLPLRLVFLAALIVGPCLPYAWQHLKPYQKQRVLTFLDPQQDPLGAGYHVTQSKIAIGSGQWAGKGYLHGTQNQLNFLPEQHTDFIFSVFAEEWGFVGCALLLCLYIAIIVRGAVIATRARDNLGALLAAGLTGTVFWQVLVNIAMTSGVLPVVGITLPFLSYGGSSMLTLLATVGLVMNVSMRRYTF